MRRISRGLAGVIGLAVGAASAISPAAAQQGPAQAPPSASQEPVRVIKVTLVTGDVVHLTTYRDHRQTAAAERGPASGRGGFQIVERDGHMFVTPYAAMPYLARGLVDETLFDVTELASQGYDDTHARSLPLILEYATNPASVAATRSLLAQPVPAQAHRVRNLPSVGSVAVRVPRVGLGRFWEAVDDDRPAAGTRPVLSRHLRKIWLDKKVRTLLDVSVPKIGAPAAWAAGYDGKGVRVAVLDTGIDETHPDLAGRVVESANFSADPDVKDGHGHGTHVASTVAGSRAASGGRYKGVAPGVQLVIGKVLDHTGSGPSSAVIAGMEWAAAHAKIVSMSLGSGPTDGTDPESQAVNRLSAQYGTLFVIAAGNYGLPSSVASPGAADAALTVGASTKTDGMASFSSRGPRVGDRAVKPEIVAPGVNIVAARATGTWPGYPPDGPYVSLGGTSMATPHVAGAAALVAQQHPTWNGQQIKALLTSTATPLATGTVYDQGAGRVDVARAVAQPVTASTGVLSMGRFTGPYGHTEPVRKTVTYRNDGDADATLDLAVAAQDADKVPAAPGMLAVSPATVTVPAHGTAEATVTFDPDLGELGLYSGRLTATARDGKSVLTAAVGYEKELLHTVTFNMIARDGRSTFGWGRAFLFNNETGTYAYAWADSPKVEVRPGQYTLIGFVPTMDQPGAREIDSTAFTRPEVTVSGDTEIVLDARQAKPVTLRTPKPTEMVEASHSVYRSVGGHSITIGAGAWDKLSVVPSAAPARGEMEYVVGSLREAPKLTMRIAGPGIVLHPLYLNPTWLVTPRLDGHRKLPVVFAGAGRPDDYVGRDVRGKVAVVRHTPGLAIEDQVAAAVAAKAAMVAVLASGPGVFQPSVAPTVELPTVGLSQAEGADLLARLGRGKVMLDMDGIAYTPYSYKIVLPFKQIPDGLDYTVGPGNTALVKTAVHAVRRNQIGHTVVSVWRPYTTRAFSVIYARPVGFTEQRYFTAGDTSYGQTIYGDTVPNDPIWGPYESFKAGAETTERWWKGPLRPGQSDNQWPVSRNGDRFFFVLDRFVDSEPDHAASLGEKGAMRLYRDGELIATSARAAGYFEAGTAAPATYRIEYDVEKGVPGWFLSPEVQTAWTFRSAHTAAEVSVPVLRANWDLDLDLNNAAPAGRAFKLRLNASTQATATPVPVKAAKVWVSYNDGGTWKRVTVAGTGGHFTGELRHPKLVNTTGFVSLRMEVTDAGGGKLEQTVMRAYALK